MPFKIILSFPFYYCQEIFFLLFYYLDIIFFLFCYQSVESSLSPKLFSYHLICCIATYNYTYTYTNISGNLVNNNIQTSMNKRTHIFIKIYLSHFILERVDVGCVWEVSWRRGQTAIYWPQVLLTIAALLSHSGYAAQPWVTEGPKPSVCRWHLILHLVLNWLQLQLTHSVCVLVIFLFDATCFRPLIYTGASLDWWLCRGSICYKYTHL